MEISRKTKDGKKQFSQQNEIIFWISNKMSFRKTNMFLKLFVGSVELLSDWDLDSIPFRKERLESTELWCFRRTLKIRWVDRISKIEVSIRIQEQRTVCENIMERKIKLRRHIPNTHTQRDMKEYQHSCERFYKKKKRFRKTKATV